MTRAVWGSDRDSSSPAGWPAMFLQQSSNSDLLWKKKWINVQLNPNRRGYLCLCRQLFYFRVEGLLNWMDLNGRTARTNGSPVLPVTLTISQHEIRSRNPRQHIYTVVPSKADKHHKPLKSLNCHRLKQVAIKHNNVSERCEREEEEGHKDNSHYQVTTERWKEKHFDLIFKTRNFNNWIKCVAFDYNDRAN